MLTLYWRPLNYEKRYSETTKIVFGRGSAPDPAGGAYDHTMLPDPYSAGEGIPSPQIPSPQPLGVSFYAPSALRNLGAYGTLMQTPKLIGWIRACEPPAVQSCSERPQQFCLTVYGSRDK